MPSTYTLDEGGLARTAVADCRGRDDRDEARLNERKRTSFTTEHRATGVTGRAAGVDRVSKQSEKSQEASYEARGRVCQSLVRSSHHASVTSALFDRERRDEDVPRTSLKVGIEASGAAIVS